MDLGEMANLGELLAGIGTILTLIFVAFELRANRAQNRMTMLTGLDKAWNDINTQVVQDEDLGATFMRGLTEPDSLTDAEAARVWWLMAQYINNHRSVWTLLEKDRLSTHHELWLRSDISAVYNTPGGWKIFQSLRAWHPKGFVDFVERHRKTAIDFPDWRTVDIS